MNKWIPFVVAFFFFVGFCTGFTVQWIHNSKIEEIQREADLNKTRQELYRAMEQVVGGHD